MKVRVAYTVDVSDDRRRAINEWYGRPGLASRADIIEWYRDNGTSTDDDLDKDWTGSRGPKEDDRRVESL